MINLLFKGTFIQIIFLILKCCLLGLEIFYAIKYIKFREEKYLRNVFIFSAFVFIL